MVFPRNCYLCRRHDLATDKDPLCPECHAKIPYNLPVFCRKCSRHLSSSDEELICDDCRKHPPVFDEAWGLTLYQTPLKELIHAFKFHNKTALRRTFRLIASTFIERYHLNFNDYPLIIPMPLSPTRLRERGYDQALILAKELGELLNIPVDQRILARHRHTPRQSDLKEKQRWTNIQGAFSITNRDIIRGKNIILVDDLMTTGATANEATRTLKATGAAKVMVVVLSMA